MRYAFFLPCRLFSSDQSLNFMIQRWGDAPVHSIGAALFLPRSRIHFWDEIGYEHNPYTHCPKLGNNWEKGKCSCNPSTSFGSSLPPLSFFSRKKKRKQFDWTCCFIQIMMDIRVWVSGIDSWKFSWLRWWGVYERDNVFLVFFLWNYLSE